MPTAAYIERLKPEDREAVHQLLRSHKLPLEGFDEDHVIAVVAKEADAVVGSAAVEIYGSFALLRSVAVADSHRGQTLGRQLTRAAIDLAREQAVTSVYLLTQTAATFFPKFGFVAVSRDDIPAAVKQSVEFTTACPASAQAFQLSLTT